MTSNDASYKPIAPAIVVVDYKMGNLMSVVNALNFLGCSAQISDNKDVIAKASAIVLPGVGAFGMAMKNLNKLNLIDTLHRQVIENKIPFLGICLGMQLIASESEEMGTNKGLSWIPGKVKKMESRDLRIPHVGWNELYVLKKDPIFKNVDEKSDYYFVHSFYFDCDKEYISAQFDYGKKFTAAVQKDNIFATQFHPEKSQHNGLRLLRNFTNLVSNEVIGA